MLTCTSYAVVYTYIRKENKRNIVLPLGTRGEVIWQKRERMEQAQILNRLFGFKIKERKTFLRVKLYRVCIYLPTCPIKILWLHSKLKFPDFFCDKVMSALAYSEGQQEWIYRIEQLVLRHWCPHYTYFIDFLFFKLFNLWFHELHLGTIMNQIFQFNLKGIQFEALRYDSMMQTGEKNNRDNWEIHSKSYSGWVVQLVFMRILLTHYGNKIVKVFYMLPYVVFMMPDLNLFLSVEIFFKGWS